jgi:nucleoside-diphosphate-sugar epimerase
MPADDIVLLTGATGLLGGELVGRLAARHEVHVIARRQPDVPVSGVRYHLIDLATDWDPRQLPSRADRVIHLAQSTHFRDVPAQALDVFQVNVATTAKLLDHALRAGAHQFLYASSGGVYGAGNQAFHENSPIVPPGQLGYYLGSKLSGEVLVQSYVPHLQALVLRFFFIYGPGQNRGMLIPRLIDNVRAGRAVQLQGPEGIRINPIHVRDAAQAVIHAMDTVESATFNIAGSEITSIRAIAETIGTAVGKAPLYESSTVPGRDLIGDNGAMRERLHEPTMTLIRGIGEIARGHEQAQRGRAE